MAGKTINGQPLVPEVVDGIKIPTGEVGDLTISVAQLKAFIQFGLSLVDHTHLSGEIEDLADILLGKADANHGHSMEDILNLLETLGNKSNVGHLHEILDVNGLEGALTALMQLIETHTSNTNNPHNTTKVQLGLGNVDNTADENKPVSAPQAIEFNKKLEELDSPAAGGVALNMPKVGLSAKLKKLLAGQDINLTDNGDSVTVSAVGRTLKDFVEVSETVSTRFYRYFVPNISPSGTAATNIRLVGRHGTAGSNYSFSLMDATSDLKPNTGAGSVDLQIVRDSVGQTASGADNYVAGKRITVQGSNCIVLDATDTTKSVSGNRNVVIGLKHIFNGSSGTSTVSGTENTAVNVLTIHGAVTGNQNTLIGSGGSSGNNSTALGVGAGGSTGNGGLTLCHSTGNPIGGNRGMSGALTRGTANNLANHQIIEMYYTATTSVYTSGTWSNLTWDGLTAGTTNVYSAPAVGTVIILGYVRVGSTTTGRLFKVEAILINGSLSQTITFVAGDADPAYGSVQLVKSGNYIYVQIKQDIAGSTILGKATLSFTEL